MNRARLDRNIRLFGCEGQEKISACRVAIIGIGGLGTHVVQQLSLLGVGALTLVDDELIDRTNLNRYVGIRWDDADSEISKVDVGERLAHNIDPEIHVNKVRENLISEIAFHAVIASDYVFGCLDSEGARLILNELCAAYDRPLFDLATEIHTEGKPVYGGRICVTGTGCIVCRDVLDLTEAQKDLENPEARRIRAEIYGISRNALPRQGPSVVSVNGVIASLAVTEFMVSVTGIRQAIGLLTYRADLGKVTVCTDPANPDCYYCKGIRGIRNRADVQRYIRKGVCETLSR
jgi:hypothetical protein